VNDRANLPRYRLYGVTVATSFRLTYNLLPSSDEPDLFLEHDHSPADPAEYGTPVYSSSELNQEGQSAIRLYVDNDAEIIELPSVCLFHCRGELIRVHPLRPDIDYLIEICFVSIVMSYWLERRQVSAIHAASVRIGDVAIAFMAGSTGGKTTIAAHLVSGGCPLVADDIVAVDTVSQTATVRPAYPQMKLLPGQVDHFWPRHPRLELIHPSYPKLRTPIGPGGFGEFADAPCPLAAIYLLDRIDEQQPPAADPLHPGAATIELIRHSFVAQMVDAVDRSRTRMARLGTLAAIVPVRRLRYASGYDQLPVLADYLVSTVTRYDSESP
jgi:hypothetical protein